MKKIVVLLLALCLLVCGCRKTGTEVTEQIPVETLSLGVGYRDTVLYYATDDGFLVPIMRQIPWEEGIGKAALYCLVDDADTRAEVARAGLSAVIPEGTEITLRIGADAEAVVDLRNLQPLANADAEARMVSAIVNTLTEFSTVDTVRITIDGKAVGSLSNGTNISTSMGKVALNIEEGSVAVFGSGAYAMTLYFPNQAASLNVPVTRYSESVPSLSSVVEALLAGPEDNKLLACFPQGTALEFAELYDSTACIGLSSAFYGDGSMVGLQDAAYEALYLSLTALEGVDSMELYVGGELYLPQSMAVSAPLYANTF